MSQSTKGSAQSRIGIKALVIIAVLAIVYQIYISGFVDEEETSFADFSYGLSSLAVGITALFVYRRYKGSPVFGKTYLALAIGFIILFVGDSVYNYYLLVLDEDPYPSIADAFFIAFYFFTGYHLVKNIKYFKKDLGIGPKIAVPVLAIAFIAAFGLYTIETLEYDPMVYYMGILYVSASAAILSLAILGLTVFRHSVLGVAWFMLVIGIFFYSFADVWYYYLEEIEEFTIVHPVNTLWLVSNIFMVYALYKHKKTI
jgi:drug/metabolite transporter (DMT)-like permease